jgi:hypothetical protein
MGLGCAVALFLGNSVRNSLRPILNRDSYRDETKIIIPLNAALNRLLVWCIFLGSPPVEEALMVRNKSYDTSRLLFKSLTTPFTSDCLEQILNQLSKAVLLAVNGNQTPHRFIPHVLRDLAKLEARPLRLTEVAYEWCSAIYANREKFEDWESLLLVCLELGFRHLDPWQSYTNVSSLTPNITGGWST